MSVHKKRSRKHTSSHVMPTITLPTLQAALTRQTKLLIEQHLRAGTARKLQYLVPPAVLRQFIATQADHIHVPPEALQGPATTKHVSRPPRPPAHGPHEYHHLSSSHTVAKRSTP